MTNTFSNAAYKNIIDHSRGVLLNSCEEVNYSYMNGKC
jgi:hypothetical protein